MEKESQYRRPKQPAKPPVNQPGSQSNEDTSQLGKWDSFWSGFYAPFEMSAEEYNDRYLTPRNWLLANPGKNMNDYHKFRKKLTRGNWLQRVMTKVLPPSRNF